MLETEFFSNNVHIDFKRFKTKKGRFVKSKMFDEQTIPIHKTSKSGNMQNSIENARKTS